MLTDIQAAFAAHNWLVLLMLVAIYARKLTSPDSAFPITIPANWRPSVTSSFGLVIAVVATLQAGKGAGAAALAGVATAATTGFLDGLLTAIFGRAENAPSWAKALVFVFDDVGGSSANNAKTKSNGPQAGYAKLPGLMVLACVVMVAIGCAWFQKNAPAVLVQVDPPVACAINQLESGVSDAQQILNACKGLVKNVLLALISDLLDATGIFGDAGPAAAGVPPTAYELRLSNMKLQLIAMGAQ